MISVIICSTSKERLSKVSANISATIGVTYELLARDNNGSTDGICKVYNQLAAQAQYDILCFMHEDVELLTNNWGEVMANKAAHKQSGIIGFLGSAIKTKTLSGVHYGRYSHCNVLGPDKNGNVTIPDIQTLHGADFAPTITMDGLFLLMRSNVYKEVGGFDEKTFNDFHIYDIDIATAVSVAGYTNYVCKTVRAIHYSQGNFTRNWYDHLLAYHQKWEKVLPLYIDTPSPAQIEYDERYISFNFPYYLIKKRVLRAKEAKSMIIDLIKKHPFTFKSYYLWYVYQMRKNTLN